MSTAPVLLAASMQACVQRIAKLTQSVAKTRHLFPLTASMAATMTDDDEESLDALILRYSQCVSMIQDQVFRGIAYLEQEDISDKSNREKSLLMEKLGVIPSAEEIGTAAMLRNKFSHHYPDQSEARIARINLLAAECQVVFSAFDTITAYLHRKGFTWTP